MGGYPLTLTMIDSSAVKRIARQATPNKEDAKAARVASANKNPRAVD